MRLALMVLLGCRPLPPFVDTPAPVTDSGDTQEPPPTSAPFTVVGYNTESGDAVADTVASYIAQVKGESIWGFVEVQDSGWASTFSQAAPDDDSQRFEWVMGTTGRSDRVVLMWDDTRFSLEEWWELHDINLGGTVRSPVVGLLEDRDSGLQFLVMVNHLWRSDADKRHEQAQLLNIWAQQQSLPIIALGDYNFDYEVDGSGNDAGYDLMTADDVFVWVKPDALLKTQCSPYYNSVLDFVFTSGPATEWGAQAEILFPTTSYCQDDALRPDHRPVSATFSPG